MLSSINQTRPWVKHFPNVNAILPKWCLGIAVAMCCPRIGDAQSFTFKDFISFDVPGAAATQGFKINSSKTVVGLTVDATGAQQGFERFPDGTFNYPIIEPEDNDNFTVAYGINNAGTIVGQFLHNNGYHGFFLNSGTLSQFDYNAPPLKSSSLPTYVPNQYFISYTENADFENDIKQFYITNLTQTETLSMTLTVTFHDIYNPFGIVEQTTGPQSFVVPPQSTITPLELRFINDDIDTVTIDSTNLEVVIGTGVTAINNKGDYVGAIGIQETGNVLTRRGFLYVAATGAYSQIIPPGSTKTSAAGLNSVDQVVGFFSLPTPILTVAAGMTSTTLATQPVKAGCSRKRPIWKWLPPPRAGPPTR